MEPTTAPVVDARFCSPDATVFTVTRTPGSWPRRDLTVTDAGGTTVMQAEVVSRFASPSHSLLHDAASGYREAQAVPVSHRPEVGRVPGAQQ
ncbi:protein LURP-one-related 15-like [Hordeum vulgare]|nr:protein LURP-one-related 15-like [Hordeum vulgare]